MAAPLQAGQGNIGGCGGLGGEHGDCCRYTPAMVSMEYLVIEYLVNGNIQQGFETEVKRRFVKISIVSLMVIASASQFHVYLPWGQRPFSIVS